MKTQKQKAKELRKLFRNLQGWSPKPPKKVLRREARLKGISEEFFEEWFRKSQKKGIISKNLNGYELLR